MAKNSKYGNALQGFQESGKNFFQTYWKAWLFMFIGLVTLIGVAILLLSPSSESQQIGLVLAIPAIFVVLWRVFRSSQEKNWLTLAFALTLGLVFFAIIEPITQGIFIFRAWRAWQVGEHLVDKDGKVIRGL